MNKLKKIFACILTCAMLLNLSSPLADVHAAEPVDSGALTVHAATEDKKIWLTAEATAKPTQNGGLAKVAGSGSLVVGGAERGTVTYENGRYLIYFESYTPVDGGEVTVKGQFRAPDGFIINMQETTFVYNSAATPVWSIKNDVTPVDSGALKVHNNTAASRIWVKTAGTNHPTVTGKLEKVAESGSLIVGGTQRGYVHHDGNGLYIIVFDSYTPTEGAEVTVKGQFQASDGFIINMQETTFVYNSAATPKWAIKKDVTETSYVETGISELLTDASKYANEEQGWHFYLGLSKKNAKIAKEAPLAGFEYSVNGGEKKALTAFYAGYKDGSLFFIMPELGKNITKNTKITISGQGKTTDGKNGLKLTSEVTLYGNEYGWSLTGYPKATAYSKVTGKQLNNATKWNGNQDKERWEFYLELSGDTSKIPENTLLTGFEYSINDIKTKQPLGECFWSSHAGGTLLFVVRDLEPEKLTKNTKLIISGKGKTTDGAYGLELTKEVIIYGNQYGWSLDGFVAPTAYVETGISELLTNASKYANEEQGWHFYLGLSKKNAKIAKEAPLAGFEYSVNGGEKKALTAFYAGYKDGSLFFIMPELGKNITKNTKITISGQGKTTDGKNGLKLTDEVTLYGNQHGWSLDGFVAPTAYVETGISELLTNASKYENEEQGWHFYLGLSKKNAKIAKEAPLVGFQYSMNDGEKKDLTAFYAGYKDGSLFFIMPELGKNITKNTKITISGQGKTTDGKNGLKLTSEVTLYGNEYGWSLTGYPKATAYSKVTGKQLNNATKWNKYQGDERWEFYLELSGDTSKIPENAMLSGFEYSINDSKTKQPLGECFWSPHAGGTLLFVVRDIEPEKLTKNTKITISGKARTTDGANGLELTKEVTIYGNQYGWSLDGFVAPTAYVETGISELLTNASKYANEEQGWHFYLGLSKKNAKIAKEAPLVGFEYSMNGGEKKALTAFYAGYKDGSLFFIMPELGKNITKNTKITISGQGKTTDGKNGLKLTSEVTLYGNEYGWSLTGYPKATAYSKVTGKELDGATKWNKYQGDERWEFYLQLSGDTSKIPEHALLTGFEYSVNDSKTKQSLGECFWSPHAGGTLLFVVRDLEPEKLTKNTKLTISGKGKTTDGAYGLELTKEVTIYGNQYGWSMSGYPKAPTYTKINATGVNNSTSYNEKADRWDIYLNVDKMLPGADNSDFRSLKLEVNGKEYDTVVYHAGHQDTLFFAIEGSMMAKNVPNGTKVVLKAGKAMQEGKGIGIELAKDVTLYKFYDSLTDKKPTTNTKYTDVTVGSLARATKYLASADVWPIYLRMNQDIPGDDRTKFYDLKVVLNGKEVLLKGTKEGKVLFLPIPTTLLNKNAKTGTLTIKAGTKTVGGAGEVGMHFKEDFNIYLFNGVWSEDQFDEIIETELFCTRLHNCTHNNSSTLWGFYLKTDKEFPGKPWYNKFDRFQVELDGKDVTVELNKGDGTGGRIIYFGLDEKVVGKFKEGSILKLKANSVAEDGAYKTTFTKDFALIYTNGMWIEYRQTDKVAPEAQNLWDIARFDSAYIPQSEDGMVKFSGYDEYPNVSSTEKLMDQTVKFTGKKAYDDVAGAPFFIVLRGNAISDTEPISRSLLYGYVITMEGYEITEENTPNSPELWGTRSAFINVWKNGENAALSDQYKIGTHHAVTNDPYFKFDETYEYEASIYNITETSVCIEFKVNGELVYKCYDDASTDPMDPVVNPGTFGIYAAVPTYIGGETVELKTVLAEASECKVGDKVGVAATYPSMIKDAVFTVDKKGASVKDGYFVAEKIGTYTVSATYKGKELKPVTITVSEKAVADVNAEQKNNTTAVIIIVATTVVLVAGVGTAVFMTKRRKKSIEA